MGSCAVSLANRPGRLGGAAFALADPCLAAAVAAHDVDRLAAAAFGAECYEAAVRGPGRVFAAADTGQRGVSAAVAIDGVDLETAVLHAGIGDLVSLGRPAWIHII